RSYFPPANTIPHHSRWKTTNVVESEIRTNVTMADNRTMAQMLQAPIEGYEDSIVTSEVPKPTVKLLLFPFSLEGEARIWLDKEPPQSILTWEDLVSKFINQFFPPSKTTYLRNDITNFLQKSNETFNEALERFKDLLHHFNSFCYDDDDDDEGYTVVITPDFLITDSLIMENEHLDTIPETKSDGFIKSSVENLVPIPSESEDVFDIESECDMPDCDDSQTTKFSTISNPLFNDSTYSDDESSHEESYLLESLLNRDTLMASSPKIDSLLEEFFGELAHTDLIPSRINEANCDPEEDIHLVERLMYDNSSPRPLKDFNSENSDVIIESFSPSPIHVEDSDPFMKEIVLFLASDGSIPPSIDSDYSDSEGDNLFLERLLHDDPIPFRTFLTSQMSSEFFFPLHLFSDFFNSSLGTIFDPVISDYHFSSFIPGVSHRSGTFMKFIVYPNHLNESPMKILSSTCSFMDQ
nr:hypothetical protein [Tanacetum cinerariifolium]